MQIRQWRNSAREFEYRGMPVACWQAGSGPTLALIHGFPTSSWDWHRLWAPLAGKYSLLAVDMLGFGLSAKPAAYHYSIFDQADLWQAVLAEHAPGETCLLAHDYGDTVAQELLARANEGALPLQIHKVCLLNGGIFPEAQRPLPIQRLLASPLRAVAGRLITRASFDRSMQKIFGAATQPTREDLDVLWQLVNENGGRKVVHRVIRYLHERARYRDRWVSALADAACARCFIVGMADPVSGAAMAARYRELLPGELLIELDKVGHYPQLEAPAAVLDAALPFLSDSSPARTSGDLQER